MAVEYTPGVPIVVPVDPVL